MKPSRYRSRQTTQGLAGTIACSLVMAGAAVMTGTTPSRACSYLIEDLRASQVVAPPGGVWLLQDVEVDALDLVRASDEVLVSLPVLDRGPGSSVIVAVPPSTATASPPPRVRTCVDSTREACWSAVSAWTPSTRPWSRQPLRWAPASGALATRLA